LANLNYAPKGARASREEMEKATRGQLPAPQEPTPAQARAQLGKVCKEKGWDSTWGGELYESDYGVSLGGDTSVGRILGFADILAERIAQAEAQQWARSAASASCPAPTSSPPTSAAVSRSR